MTTNRDDAPRPRYTLAMHEIDMPDCDDPDCEFHHPELIEE